MLGGFDLTTFLLISLWLSTKICHSLKPIWFSVASGVWSSWRSAFSCVQVMFHLCFLCPSLQLLLRKSALWLRRKWIGAWRTFRSFVLLMAEAELMQSFPPPFSSWIRLGEFCVFSPQLCISKAVGHWWAFRGTLCAWDWPDLSDQGALSFGLPFLHW